MLKIVMSELYKRFLGVEPANKLKKALKREGKKKKTFFLNFEKTNFILVGQTPNELISNVNAFIVQRLQVCRRGKLVITVMLPIL